MENYYFKIVDGEFLYVNFHELTEILEEKFPVLSKFTKYGKLYEPNLTNLDALYEAHGEKRYNEIVDFLSDLTLWQKQADREIEHGYKLQNADRAYCQQERCCTCGE